MSRKFIAAILAASLAVTTFFAAPAKASDAEDIAKFLGAAATLYIIGSAIKDSRDGNKGYVTTQRDHGRYDHGRKDRNRYDRGRRDDDRYDRGRGDRGRYDNGRDRDRTWRGPRPLPSQCLLRSRDRKYEGRVLGARCVERNYRQARRLPDSCRVQMRTEKGIRVVYLLRCLRRAGYEVARR